MGDKAIVQINPEKPGRGNFIIRVGDKEVVKLEGLKRPFPPLKALDMEKVCADTVKAVEEAAS